MTPATALMEKSEAKGRKSKPEENHDHGSGHGLGAREVPDRFLDEDRDGLAPGNHPAALPVWGNLAPAAGMAAPADFLREARLELSDGVLDDTLTRALYSTDASIYQIEPLAVATPRNAREVSALHRLAWKHGVSIIPRGGGSGLAGETLGKSLVFDLSKHFTRILDIKVSEDGSGQQEYVRAEAGAVLDTVNKALGPFERKLGPDPASSSRCVVGGVIANNSSGAHSLRHGLFRHHLLELDCVLANGERVTFKRIKLGGPEHNSILSRDTLEAKIYRRVEELCRKHKDLIRSKWPFHLKRHRSGYLLEGVLDDEAGTIDLAQLICGSEGTLATILEAKLNIVPMPQCKGLVMLLFDDLVKACATVSPILGFDPYACELLDSNIIGMARTAGRGYEEYLPEGAHALLMVEFDGDTEGQVEAKLDGLIAEMVGKDKPAFAYQKALKESDQKVLWQIRKSGEPLLYRRPGHEHPVGFIEDCAVDPHKLADYVQGKIEIFRKHEVEFATYAHAGAGVLHTRPFLDLSQPEHLDKMEAIADEVYELLIRLGGSISGEHGDGLSRTAYLERQFGPELYKVFHEIKDAFDPKNLLNPGKIVYNSDPHLVRHNLRHGAHFQQKKPLWNLNWKPGELEHEANKCNGCGECRAVERVVAMCPIFKATGDESASPRAKGNLMRLLTSGQLDPQWAKTDEFRQVADKCVNCKACFLECPVNVNIPMMMLEAKAEHTRQNGLGITNTVLVQAELMSKVNCLLAPIANWVANQPLLRWGMELVLGIDRRRRLPKFDSKPFMWFRNKVNYPAQQEAPAAAEGRKVVYFVDLFANYNDPLLAEAFVQVFTHNGIEVVVPPNQEGCGMPAMDYGDVPLARKIISRNAKALRPYIDKGYTVITQEPTATLSLHEEYLYFVDNDDTRALAHNVRDAMDYLRDLDRAGKLRTDFVREVPQSFAYQLPCHLKALRVGLPGVEITRKVPGVSVREINKGCCGIAGTWGMKKSAFDTSMASGQPMIDEILREDISLGLSECSTCKMQMEQGAPEKPTMHPLKVLAHAYGLMEFEELSFSPALRSAPAS
jgi:FAD/FMN-containing dehydrogenase/Fe-S oxidoreductase